MSQGRRTRENAGGGFRELRGWPYAMAQQANAAWRRTLAFGYLDPGSGLTPRRRLRLPYRRPLPPPGLEERPAGVSTPCPTRRPCRAGSASMTASSPSEPHEV